MRAYSMDQRVLRDADAGVGTSVLAAKYPVGPAWVRRLRQRRKATGETAPRRQRRRGQTPGWILHVDLIRKAVAVAPDATLAEYRQRFAIPLSKSALARARAHLGLTRKKSQSGRVGRTGPK